MRRGWHVSAAANNKRVLFNNVEYALYVDQGHRIVRNVGGQKIESGWVPGKFILKKAVTEMENSMQRVFSEEFERALKKNGL